MEGDIVAEEVEHLGTDQGNNPCNSVKLNGTAVVEGDIFHKSLSIEENARFEGLSKRDDGAVDLQRMPLRTPAAEDAFQTDAKTVEGKRNGQQAVTESLN